MQAQVLQIPPEVTDRERADEWADQLEDLLLEVGQVFPRADLRRPAAGCVRGLLGPSSRKNGWQLAECIGDARINAERRARNLATALEAVTGQKIIIRGGKAIVIEPDAA
jgi:hypothetical protein